MTTAAIIFIFIIVLFLLLTVYLGHQNNPLCVLTGVVSGVTLIVSSLNTWTYEYIPVKYTVAQTATTIYLETENPKYKFQSDKKQDFDNWSLGKPGQVILNKNVWGFQAAKFMMKKNSIIHYICRLIILGHSLKENYILG